MKEWQSAREQAENGTGPADIRSTAARDGGGGGGGGGTSAARRAGNGAAGGSAQASSAAGGGKESSAAGGAADGLKASNGRHKPSAGPTEKPKSRGTPGSGAKSSSAARASGALGKSKSPRELRASPRESTVPAAPIDISEPDGSGGGGGGGKYYDNRLDDMRDPFAPSYKVGFDATPRAKETAKPAEGGAAAATETPLPAAESSPLPATPPFSQAAAAAAVAMTPAEDGGQGPGVSNGTAPAANGGGGGGRGGAATLDEEINPFATRTKVGTAETPSSPLLVVEQSLPTPDVADSGDVRTVSHGGDSSLTPDGEVIYDYRKLVWSDEGRQLPPGVNAAKLEAHLSDGQFEEVLGMGRTKFYAMTKVEQMRCKQEVGLF